MILSRTPFRLTLGGGGTDLPSYYEKHGGLLVAMGIDKYMHVAINPPIVGRHVRVSGTRNETVSRAELLTHELAREALLRHGIRARMEIASVADLPDGTGLGSAGCYLVGLLAALRAYRRTPVSPDALAEEAFEIQTAKLGMTVGKQDSWLAATGGVCALEIGRDGVVKARPVRVHPSTFSDFVTNVRLYYTGVRRNTIANLKDQDRAMREQDALAHDVVQDALHHIKDLGYQCLEAIETQNYDRFGSLMDEHWQQKKRLSPKVAIPGIDDLYAEARQRFAVLGGKLTGAGGGGFFVAYAPKNHAPLDAFMYEHGLERMHYAVDYDGARIVSNTASTTTGTIDHEPAPQA